MNETNQTQPDASPACLERNGSGLSRYERDVMRSVKANHMWLNAFACIRPSDELKMQIGEWVLAQLASKETTILSDWDDSALADLKMREAVLRFNKS